MLAAAIGLTMLARHFRTDYVEQHVQAQQRAVVTDAFERIEADFAAMQEMLRRQGEFLSNHRVVTEALSERLDGVRRESPALIRYFAALELPDRWAIELYDPSLDLVAWSGFSLPHTEAAAERGLKALHVSVAVDADWRRAIAVWYPVRVDGRLLGTVRVVELIYARTPVQNDELATYRVEDAWQRGIRRPVRMHFDQAGEVDDSAHTLSLTGIDGSVLGRIVVDPPKLQRLVELEGRRYDDVAAFWATLLLLWFLAGSWSWYRRNEDATAAGIRLCMFGIALSVGRYVLLALDVPARWQLGKAPLNLLFDPVHVASTVGGGVMRSPGDLLFTALFALVFSFSVFGYAKRHFTPVGESSATLRGLWRRVLHTTARGRMIVGLAATAAVSVALVALLAVTAHYAVVDSTLDWFTRGALIPPPLILIVSCALVITALSILLVIVSLAWVVIGATAVGGRQEPRSAWRESLLILGAVATLPSIVFLVFDLQQWVPWMIAVAFPALGFALAIRGLVVPAGALQLLTLRSVLPGAFALSVLLYPLQYDGMDYRKRQRMEYAASTFDRGHDPHVLFAVHDILTTAERDSTLARLVVKRAQSTLDLLAERMVGNSLLSSLGAHDVSLAFLDSIGGVRGRFALGEDIAEEPEVSQARFDVLQQMKPDDGGEDVFVELLVGERDPDKLQYAGIVPIGGLHGEPVGWIMASAEPHLLLEDADTPLLRILVSSGDGGLYDDLSLAVFHDGLMVRSFGRRFGRYVLDESVERELAAEPVLWRAEKIRERSYQTFYRHEQMNRPADDGRGVVAVRTPATSFFDDLFYLLRLTVAGLFVGLPFYVVGLVMRMQSGQLRAPRVRFRDKVLNVFLGVGILSVVVVGLVGVQVVTEENDRAIQSWLRQHLQRVEEALLLEARDNETASSVLERISLDSLAARVGLDLNLYQRGVLVTASRSQLVRERLIDRRLPVRAHEALNLDGYKVTFVEDRIGKFGYTAGYWAVLDETGRTRYVVSVPTLPEQERIQEERSRTLAYLFGSLLALLMVVMMTAAISANFLARPIASLRQGLAAVAQGHFERLAPVNTRDEVGELVDSFNDMQGQLVESRRKLTQQERQLAWREMARQVAHEIRNPLTPMKLSLQHLYRAWVDGDGKDRQRFGRLIHRITTTLVEQIDSLAHIANEFATFARMPARMVERIDCNDVIREAVSLMQVEAQATVGLRLHTEPIMLEADRKTLRRTFINLIKNALEAIRDTDQGRVTVSSTVQEGILYTAVHDTGTGIAPELRERIFEPNFSTKTSGTGLGLAIARSSIEAMGGTMGFETEPGRGTTFWIRVPLAE